MKKKKSGGSRAFLNAMMSSGGSNGEGSSSSAKTFTAQQNVLNSYVDKGSVSIVPISSSNKEVYPKKLSDVKTPPRTVALEDDVAQYVNRVSNSSIVESGQANILQDSPQLDDDHMGWEDEEDEDERSESPPLKGEIAGEMERILPDCSVVEFKETLTESVVAAEISTLEDYQLRDDRDMMYFKHLHEDESVPDNVVSQIPHYQDILKYAHTLNDAPSWYSQLAQMVVNSAGASFPQLEVINRKYISQFLRAPTENDVFERPCGNENCESLRLSSRLLEVYPHMRTQGLQRGFRCRELLLPDLYMKVLTAKKQPKNRQLVQQVLPMMPQPCYLCHLHLTNRAYWLRLNKNHHREHLPEGSIPAHLQDATVIIHRFVVPINVPGEYNLADMLMGDSEPMGIIGPFPRYNVNNYTPYMDAR